MTQPKALRLADELEKDRWHITGVTAHEASEELRRLHDLLGKANALCRIRLDRIEKLEAVMVNAQGNLERISLVQTGVGIGIQPVAWMYDFLNPDNRDEVIRNWVTQDLSEIDGAKGFNVRPLYTAPPPRQPLTDEQICPWFQENTALTNEAAMRITRAIEAAHGITGE